MLPCCVFVKFDSETNDKHKKFLRKVCFIVVQYGRKQLAVVGIATRLHAGQPKIQSDSVARGPKLLSIKNYVIEIMT